MKENIELLSPSGNMSSFYAACNGGANAIYMGLKNFNARTMAENFSKEEYIDCILKAHILNLKVYLTLNVLLFDNEVNEALNLIVELYNYGLDAVIVQDIGLAHLIHKKIPDLALHASTQMSIYSLEQVKFLKSIGFKRVVLARELTIEEIKYIRDNTDIELEVFIHGALCVSYSGQCLMSAVIGSRSANRGSCAQPCRMKYSLVNSKGKELIKNKYLLSKKDIYGLEYINKLIDIGVDSLKIEGRGRTAEYVYLVTSKYRKYIDNKKSIISDSDKKELMQIFNRSGFCSGYFDSIKHEESISINSPKNTGLYLGEVINQKKEYIKLRLTEDISMHDGIEIYDEEKDVPVSTIVTCIKDDNFKNINVKRLKGNYVWIGDIARSVKFGSKVYKTSDVELNSSIKENINGINDNVKRIVNINICFKLNERPKYETEIFNKKIEVQGNDIVESSISKSLNIEDIKNNLSKNKELLFKFNLNICDIDDNVYVPISTLNKLRNDLSDKIIEAFKIQRNPFNSNFSLEYNLPNQSINNKYNSLYVYEYDEKTNYIDLYSKKFGTEKLDRLYINIATGYKNISKIKNIVEKYSNVEIYLYISNIVGKNQDKYIKENMEKFINLGIKGFLIGSYTYFELLLQLKKKYDIKLVADYSLNISNKYSAIFLKNLGFDNICIVSDYIAENIKDISKIPGIEFNLDKITVMTSRYCMISSFLRDKNLEKCSMPCLKDKYKLKDLRNYTYDIYTDNIDCIMKIVRNIKNIDIKDCSLRRTI